MKTELLTTAEKRRAIAIHAGFLHQFTLMCAALEGVESLRARLKIHIMQSRCRVHEREMARLKTELERSEEMPTI